MILRTDPKCQTDWQIALANMITDPAELLAELGLDPNLFQYSDQARQSFPLRVPRGFVARMEKGNPNDPLLKQVLPLGEELHAVPGYVRDPLQEKRANPLPGLLHKYQGRVLITVTGSCAVNCRYCFRRHFPYAENIQDSCGWDNILDYIAKDSTIKEVIFSGGDPLVAKDKSLLEFTQKIARISHLKTLRIHTRFPIIIPERVTNELLAAITHPQLRTVMVLHCNHANEIDDTVRKAMQRLRSANITLLNQSVLLKDVNDDAATLIALSEKLFDVGILPYYLNLLDKVDGSAHFDVSVETAKKLLWEIIAQLPGYLVPKLVREQPGAIAKMPVNLNHFPSPTRGEGFFRTTYPPIAPR